jgi:hypothetical protein
VVVPTSLQVDRLVQILSKELVTIKFNAISHDVVRSPCQFMGQGRMSNHAIGFGGFSVKKCFGWFVETFG